MHLWPDGEVQLFLLLTLAHLLVYWQIHRNLPLCFPTGNFKTTYLQKMLASSSCSSESNH